MDLRRAGGITGPVVTGFRGGLLIVDGTARIGGVLLTPEAVQDWNGENFDAVANLDPPPEFILLGTGASLVRPEASLLAAYESRGIGIEAMDTRAAARAWAVLRAEGRWIAAALRAP